VFREEMHRIDCRDIWDRGVKLGVAMLKSYRDLEVWNRAHALVLEVYRLTNPFPRSELFGVVSQIRRAAYSIPANIAEGFGRRSTRELLQFISIANGALEELHYFLLLSRDLRYLSPVDLTNLEKELRAVAQMLEALARSLRQRIARASAQSGREPTMAAEVSSSSRGTGHGSRDTKTFRGVTH
jgi:four helix bundle protein